MPPEVPGKKIHLLRISKTGSTTLKSILSDRPKRSGGTPVIMHSHKTILPDVLQSRGNVAAFFLREPLSRFSSGFRSRVVGLPTNTRHIPRLAKERTALEHFSSPNELAEALDSRKELLQDRAYAAMSALMHASLHYVDWLVSLDYLQRRAHRIAYIGFQETFDDDVRRFFELAGGPPVEQVPHERQTARSTGDQLSERAQRNLRAWYADDIAIYEWALAWREQHLASAGGSPAPAPAATVPPEGALA